MTEQAKPTYEQLEANLADQQYATGVVLQQRDAANNQIVNLSTVLNRTQSLAQALQAQVADLTQKLATRAEQRAGKRK